MTVTVIKRFWQGAMLALCLASALTASAGVLTRATLEQFFPLPYVVADKDTALPVWPLFQQNATENRLVAYVFESIDLAPIPGFSGVPLNLLIALDANGAFLDVRVLSQHEPVFLDGLGAGPLHTFVSQYKNLSLKQNIRILTSSNAPKTVTTGSADIDGVTKATASVRIINQTILSSALKVARKKLGFAAGRDPDLIASIKPELAERHSVGELIQTGMLGHLRLSNAEVEALFQGSNASGLDPQALERPQDTFIDLYLAYVSVPSIGRNLLTEASWNKLQGRLDPGDHAILLLSKGRYSVIGEDFVRGGTPTRIDLKQDQLSIEMRDLNLDLTLTADANNTLALESVAVFKVISQAGLDPSRPLDFSLPLTRLKGMIYPEKITRLVDFNYRLAERFYTVAAEDHKSWRSMWVERWLDLGILALGLTVLTTFLWLQQRHSVSQRHLDFFRSGFLLFTLCFVGWYAQGQLSVVNLTSMLQALSAGRSLGFMLYDPMTVTLAAFVLLSLLVWGRGTFCGWLCPFGALQEFAAKLAKLLNIRPIRLKTRTDQRLKWIKYFILSGILLSALFSTNLTDKLVEAEPFKTAITLNFVRAWPFVLYAVALLLGNLFIYKFYCRFLCPLGAALALLGRARRLNWIARRSECGQPCQTCRYQCAYQAIAPDGKVDYEECFQCLECVVIHASEERCPALMLPARAARIIPIQKA